MARSAIVLILITLLSLSACSDRKGFADGLVGGISSIKTSTAEKAESAAKDAEAALSEKYGKEFKAAYFSGDFKNETMFRVTISGKEFKAVLYGDGSISDNYWCVVLSERIEDAIESYTNGISTVAVENNDGFPYESLDEINSIKTKDIFKRNDSLTCIITVFTDNDQLVLEEIGNNIATEILRGTVHVAFVAEGVSPADRLASYLSIELNRDRIKSLVTSDRQDISRLSSIDIFGGEVVATKKEIR
jgi:hypothetical protein